MPRPTVFPEFASQDLNNGTGGAPNVVEPSESKKDSGWNEGERPPRETFNWLHRITNDWIVYLDEQVEGAAVQAGFRELPSLHTGLLFFMAESRIREGGLNISENQSSVTLTDNATNYVYYDASILDTATSTALWSEGNRDRIPLFIVTTLAGAITNVVDVRTWAFLPSALTSYTDTHEMRNAGSATQVQVLTGLTPVPDVSLTNVFRLSVSGGTSVVIQDAINTGTLGALQSQVVFFHIEFAGSTGILSFTNQYQFLNRLGTLNGGGVQIGMGGGTNSQEILVMAVWEPQDAEWRCEIIGGAAGLPGRIGCMAFRSAAQSITNNIDTAISFNAELYDYGGTVQPIHDNAVNPTRFTVPNGVTRIRIKAGIMWQVNGTGQRRIRILRNGSSSNPLEVGWNTASPMEIIQDAAGGGFETGQQIETPALAVGAGDYFELYAFQNSGGALNALEETTWMEVEVLG